MGYAINNQGGMRCVYDADECISGETYFEQLPNPWPPAPTNDQLAKQIRDKRNEYLSELDKVILRHRREKDLGVATKLTDAQYTQVLQIAQDLANVPEQSGFPTNVTWPTKPSWLTDPDGDE